ncbi:hypothetical protein C8Q76DRAFT_95373 [Earliella scabrosa]|nr:hypothetical protein C8Q76DRAFT_95373 [Earliella scabrosa]
MLRALPSPFVFLLSIYCTGHHALGSVPYNAQAVPVLLRPILPSTIRCIAWHRILIHTSHITRPGLRSPLCIAPYILFSCISTSPLSHTHHSPLIPHVPCCSLGLFSRAPIPYPCLVRTACLLRDAQPCRVAPWLMPMPHRVFLVQLPPPGVER